MTEQFVMSLELFVDTRLHRTTQKIIRVVFSHQTALNNSEDI
jgi:hypothetical protein